MLRALLAAGLAALLAASAAHGHVHAGGDPHEAPCAVCQLRSAEPSGAETPDVAPAAFAEGAVARSPGLPPVTGAPLGAIPGQSPPAAA